MRKRAWRLLMIAGLLVGLVPLLPVGIAVADDAVVDGACLEADVETALAAAQTNGGGTITFDCGGATTITFTSVKTITAGNSVVIDGAGLITLDGADTTRMFDVESGATLELHNIAINNGNDAADTVDEDLSGAIGVLGTLRVVDSSFDSNNGGWEGGAIDIDGGTAEISGTAFTNNTADYGGAINVEPGLLTINGGSFTGNTVEDDGGAIYAAIGTTVSISGTQFLMNTSTTNDGGAIYSDSTLTVDNSTFTENYAYESGGAIDNDEGGSTTITNSEFYGNWTDAQDGGAIDNEADLNISGSRFEGNIGYSDGGAIWSDTATLTISDTVFVGNSTMNADGGALALDVGSIAATITNSEFIDNQSTGDGGAIGNYAGTLEISGTLFESNSGSDGGALDPDGGSTTITESTFVGNQSVDNGGAIDYDGDSLTILRSTFSNNEAGGEGGGLHVEGSAVTVETSTFSGNYAGDEDGGGVHVEAGTVAINNSTITNNEASDDGSGISTDEGSVTLRNTIVADNTGEDCDASITSNGYNLDSDGSCSLGQPTDISSGVADLGPLSDYGGPTMTHLPMESSDAVNNGGGCSGVDQRGRPRPVSGCEIGSVELQTAATYLLCVNYYTSRVISPTNGQCGSGTYELMIPDMYPLTFCIDPYTGIVHLGRDGCNAPRQPHVMPDNGDLLTCVNLYTGVNRRVHNESQCTAMERPNVIPAEL